MINIYKKIWLLYNSEERKKILLLLVMMVLMAILEVTGVSSIMPFLAVLANPDIINTNQYLNSIYITFNFDTVNSFLFFLGTSSFCLLLFGAIFKAFTYYLIMKFSNLRRHSISQKLLKGYIQQPYSFFLKRNSSDISKTVLSETDALIGQIIMPSLNLIVNLIVFVTLLSVLLFVDVSLASILFGIFGTFYFIIYAGVKNFLGEKGIARVHYNALRFKISAEIINGIKELKILGRERVYMDSFSEPSEKFSKYSAIYKSISGIPSYFLEVIAFGAILILSLYTLNLENGSLENTLPLLGLYAISAMKIKPVAHTIYSNIATMKFGAAGLDNIIRDLDNMENKIDNKSYSVEKMQFEKFIYLNDISFSYDNTNNYSLKNIDIKIDVNTTVGIIGTTGAGKSTLVDILIGLLEPSKGKISVDESILKSNNLRKWQNSIGYVPQTIFLADDTIAGNIAFGVPNKEIDDNMIIEACKMAQLDSFVDTLPEKYMTIVGERGVRLSGGQRQRIGIARALYNNPDILILDEATSALDTNTESEVMKSIEMMNGTKTIIMIAHRLSTVEKCDQIIRLEKGKIVEIINNRNNNVEK